MWFGRTWKKQMPTYVHGQSNGLSGFQSSLMCYPITHLTFFDVVLYYSNFIPRVLSWTHSTGIIFKIQFCNMRFWQKFYKLRERSLGETLFNLTEKFLKLRWNLDQISNMMLHLYNLWLDTFDNVYTTMHQFIHKYMTFHIILYAIMTFIIKHC